MDEGENNAASSAMPMSLSLKSNELSVGEIFETRYEIKENLGSGASGTTYKAYDSILQRVVALKVIHKFLLQSHDAVERFRKEGALSTTLSHSNIIRVYLQGVSEDGRLYIVMDCLEGETLSQLLQKSGRLNVDLFFNLMLQIQDALIYAHRQGIVHRDIKPDNIVVVSDGDSKKAILLDFGIAKCVDLNNNQDATKTASMLGSSAYMSPEQCKGQQIDGRADIYSLACVMFESLSGKAPFIADTPLEVMYKQTNEPPENLVFFKQLPKSLSALILKCMQKQPEQRFQHVEDLRSEFVKCSEKFDGIDANWNRNNLVWRNRTIVSVASLVLLASICSALLETEVKSASSLLPKGKSVSSSRHHMPVNEEDLTAAAREIRNLEGDEAAIKYLQEWERKNGNDARLIDTQLVVWECLSYINSSMGNEREALRYLDLSLSKNRPIPPLKAISDLVQAYRRRAQPEKGLALLKSLSLRLQPNTLPVTGYAGIKQLEAQCYLDMKDYRSAISCLKKALNTGLVEDESQLSLLNQIRGFLVWSYTALGQKSDAEREINSILKETKEAKNDRYVSMGSAYREVADSLYRGGSLNLSCTFLEKAIDVFTAARDLDQAASSSIQLSTEYIQLNQFAAAEKCLQKAIKLPVKDFDRERIFDTLVNVKRNHEGSSAALECSRAVIKTEEAALKNDKGDLCTQESKHYVTAATVFWSLLFETKRVDEAFAFMDNWVSNLRAKAGDSSTLAWCLRNEADVYANRSKVTKALDCINKTISILEDKSVVSKCLSHQFDVSADLSDAYSCKASILNSAKRPSEALAALSYCLSYTKRFPDDYLRAIDINYQFTQSYVLLGKKDEAAGHMEVFYTLLRTHFPPQSDSYARYLWQYADYRYCCSDYPSATKLFAETVDIMKKLHGPNFEPLRLYYCYLAKSLVAEHKPAEAIKVLESSLAVPRAAGTCEQWYVTTLMRMQEVYLDMGDLQRSQEYGMKALQVAQDFNLPEIYTRMAEASIKSKDSAKTVQIMQEGLARMEKAKSFTIVQISDARLGLSSAYIGNAQYKDAEDILSLVLKDVSGIGDPKSQASELARTYHCLGSLRLNQGKPKEGADYLEKAVSCAERAGPNDLGQLKASLSLWSIACKQMHDDAKAADINARLKKLG